MTLKQKIHAHYTRQIQDREDAFRDMIAALTEDSKNDAKGSAGDKHETALSMMHIEQEKLNRKLAEILEQKAVMGKINPDAQSDKIALGSLIEANNMLLFLSAALPKITVDGLTIIAVSPQSPLGSHLMGNQAGFSFEINNTKYVIGRIY
jgi:transcription elongation GreA/GreB family factor